MKGLILISTVAFARFFLPPLHLKPLRIRLFTHSPEAGEADKEGLDPAGL